MNEKFADVYLKVENEIIPAHRIILASRSEYFRKILYEKEDQQKGIWIPGNDAETFKMLLTFIYSGKLVIKSENAIKVLEMANVYGFQSITDKISEYFQKNFSFDNIVDVFNLGCRRSFKQLERFCFFFVCEHFEQMFEKDLLRNLSHAALKLVAERTHCIRDDVACRLVQQHPEFETTLFRNTQNGLINLVFEQEINHIKIFLLNNEPCSYYVEASIDQINWKEIVNHREYHCNSTQNLYFPNAKVKFLRILGGFNKLEIENFIVKLEDSIPSLRDGLLHPTYNVATAEMGAWSSHDELLNGNVEKYAVHDIPDNESFLIRLSQPYVIDSFSLLLYDKDNRFCHYFIECSCDNKQWTELVNRRDVKSYSWQHFKFKPTAMVYIRITGTYNSMHRWFHCIHFECPSSNLEKCKRVGVTYNKMTSQNEEKLINLESEQEVNYLEMTPRNKDESEPCSYYVEASIDKLYWNTVVDYREYDCSSIQRLYFPTQKIKYLNVVGVDCEIEVDKLNAKLEASIPRLYNGLIQPTYNVATPAMGAWAGEHGELLNGNTTVYGGDFGYAVHDIPKNGCFIIRLSQPYVIDSLRFLLYDKDDRFCYYYIEYSLDNQKWTELVDRRNVKSRSWQDLTFKPRPMVYIKIVGTYNSMNRWFHCIHFECPSQRKTTGSKKYFDLVRNCNVSNYWYQIIMGCSFLQISYIAFKLACK